jgi:hypothetical protein
MRFETVDLNNVVNRNILDAGLKARLNNNSFYTCTKELYLMLDPVGYEQQIGYADSVGGMRKIYTIISFICMI